ncbi:MAG: hypothetical protein FJZ07_02550 [Candidatus Nealsonbacteria bacterium]|nr:hypothetical protein [Candidatus Nealsonbacteria bacterium]
MKFFFKDEAFICYFILAVFALILSSVFYQIQIDKFLANITQTLVIEEINPVRASYGLSHLKTNEKLTQAAQLKAEDMLARNYFSHTGPEGEPPWFWLEYVGYQYIAAGENLAIDVNDPIVLRDAWMASPSHAKSILNSYFTDIGIGVARGKMEERNTLVVVMFLGREVAQSHSEIFLPRDEPEKALTARVEIIEEAIKEISSQEPLVVNFVEEEEFEKDNLIIAAEAEKLTSITGERNNGPDPVRNRIFLYGANKFPKILRIFLTIFFGFLILWLIISLAIRRQGANFVVPRLLILIILSLLPWIVV